MLGKFEKDSKQSTILRDALALRNAAASLMEQNRYLDAMERTVDALRVLRDFPGYENEEFRAVLVSLLFDLAEIHFTLKNYKQSEKELDALFKVLDHLVKSDEARFGKFHVLAMELSTRILRSRKKALDLLVKQQISTGTLYDKVNSGVVAATDKLVDALRNTGQLLAATGDLRASMKFYAEAIKLSKKRTGKVSEKEIKMTLDLAEVMIRLRSMRPRAKRLLNTVLPYAIARQNSELERDILSLVSVIDRNEEHENSWRNFMHKIAESAKKRFKKDNTEENVNNSEH